VSDLAMQLARPGGACQRLVVVVHHDPHERQDVAGAGLAETVADLLRQSQRFLEMLQSFVEFSHRGQGRARDVDARACTETSPSRSAEVSPTRHASASSG
jgi:hypothetical protein